MVGVDSLDNDILFLPEDEQDLSANKSKAKPLASKTIFNWFLFVTSFAISLALLIMFFSAADSIKTGGLDIMSIESVGGRTLEEAYYHGLGYIYEGYCIAIKAFGLFCSALLLLFGISRLKNVKQ